MSNPRVFISFDFDHNEHSRNLLVGQARSPLTPFNIQDWSSRSSLPQSQWERIIEDKISRCNVVLVLVGRHTAFAAGVMKEIAMAHRNNVPVFGVYTDGTGIHSLLPDGLQRNRTISWTWAGISSAIAQTMTEGKNSSRNRFLNV